MDECEPVHSVLKKQKQTSLSDQRLAAEVARGKYPVVNALNVALVTAATTIVLTVGRSEVKQRGVWVHVELKGESYFLVWDQFVFSLYKRRQRDTIEPFFWRMFPLTVCEYISLCGLTYEQREWALASHPILDSFLFSWWDQCVWDTGRTAVDWWRHFLHFLVSFPGFASAD